MGLFGLCETDPILDFIRETYGAVPIRLPDQRLVPLTIFTVDDDGRSRFLGHVSELKTDGAWTAPPLAVVDLVDVVATKSSVLSWEMVLDLAGPFLAVALQLPIGDIELAFGLKRARTQASRISIGEAERHYVHPLSLASALDEAHFALPTGIRRDFVERSQALYVADSVLTAHGLTVSVVAERSVEAAIELEHQLAGALKPKVLLRTKDSVTILGERPAPFAFTCLRIELSEEGRIQGVSLADQPRAGATGAQIPVAVEHIMFGAPNEMFMFDV